ncbi:MAG: class II aldolase/adducin family protein [Pseudomonadota bacterium]|nr:class II aldolase/adducin family protein [Pseudomonadota bacterium]
MCASPVIQKLEATDRAVDEVEWETRVDLAACYRLIEHYDMDDLFATHISVRAPGADDHFLLNPYGVHFSEITASSLVKVDLDGNIVQKTDHVINPAGFVIHSAVHSARHDAKCVLHTHTVAGMAIATMEDGLQPMFQKAMRFYDGVAYHDFEGVAEDLDERERLVQDLGEKNYLVLRNHGLLVCGPTIGQAFKEMFAMEKACKTQLAIMQAGGKVIKISDNLLQHTAQQFARNRAVTKERPSGWASMKKMLDRVNPGYDT